MSLGPSLEHYLQKGMYGPKETKPEERRKFLGTLRERVIIALFVDQVYEEKIYPEIAMMMKKYRDAHLLLNGSIRYNFLSRYIQIAKKNNIPFTIVKNEAHDTDIGLVLATNYAIEKKEIFVKKEATHSAPIPAQKKRLFKKLFINKKRKLPRRTKRKRKNIIKRLFQKLKKRR